MPFIGEIEVWDRAEAALKKSLNASGKEWELNEGDGAFYGPKIDVILKDSLGREQQTATIQLDFQLPIRFGLEYVDQIPTTDSKEDIKDVIPESSSEVETPDAKDMASNQKMSKPRREVAPKGVPVMIHRAIFGSVERFMAMLMEHYKGYWPFWLNPNQAIVIPVSSKPYDKDFQVAKKLSEQLSGIPQDGTTIQPLSTRTFRVGFEARDVSLKKKIQLAYAERYQYMIVVGDREAQSGQFELQSMRDFGKTRGLSADDIYKHFVQMEDTYK